jgi:hypothetical protein
MTGALRTTFKLHFRPGKERVVQKLGIQGSFELHQIHFANPEVQDNVDMLSLRARGEPEAAEPGAAVRLHGVYSLDGKQFDFVGKVRTEAKLSQMVASRWKSWMLKVVDPFFHKNGAGAEIPVKVTGTNSAPKLGLALKGGKEE